MEEALGKGGAENGDGSKEISRLEITLERSEKQNQ